MTQQVHEIIRQAILSSSTKTAQDLGVRTDGHLVIKEEDWSQLAQVVADNLNSPAERAKEFLPVYDSVLFLLKKMGMALKLLIVYHLVT